MSARGMFLWMLGPIVMGIVWLIFFASITTAECRPYPVGPNSPTGIVGCAVYGEGTASHWQGPGVARNDCEWPWDACTPITITSIDTGRSITVTPTMFCDCYTGTADERIVDLDPRAVAALGLRWEAGLYPVTVAPAGPGAVGTSPTSPAGNPPAPLLPDTATACVRSELFLFLGIADLLGLLAYFLVDRHRK